LLPRHHRQPLRHHHFACNPGKEKSDRNQEQPFPTLQRSLRPRQKQADGDGRDRQRQRHRKLQVEKRIVHRRHEILPNAQSDKQHRHRNRRGGKQP
jgi:hypothetical protein